MTDKITMIIDCDAGLVEAQRDLDERFFDLGQPATMTKAEMISIIIGPQIRDLMKLPDAELQRKFLEYIEGLVT